MTGKQFEFQTNLRKWAIKNNDFSKAQYYEH